MRHGYKKRHIETQKYSFLKWTDSLELSYYFRLSFFLLYLLKSAKGVCVIDRLVL